MYQVVEISTTYTRSVTSPWLSPAEHDAWRSLQLMQLQLATELNRRLSPYGLTLQDYYVLAHLSENGGEMRIVELGHDLGLEKSRASHHIARLCERGLLTKRRCETDGRGYWARLTAKGNKLIASAAPSHVADVRELFIARATSTQLSAIASVSKDVSAGLASLT